MHESMASISIRGPPHHHHPHPHQSGMSLDKDARQPLPGISTVKASSPVPRPCSSLHSSTSTSASSIAPNAAMYSRNDSVAGAKRKRNCSDDSAIDLNQEGRSRHTSLSSFASERYVPCRLPSCSDLLRTVDATEPPTPGSTSTSTVPSPSDRFAPSHRGPLGSFDSLSDKRRRLDNRRDESAYSSGHARSELPFDYTRRSSGASDLDRILRAPHGSPRPMASSSLPARTLSPRTSLTSLSSLSSSHTYPPPCLHPPAQTMNRGRSGSTLPPLPPLNHPAHFPLTDQPAPPRWIEAPPSTHGQPSYGYPPHERMQSHFEPTWPVDRVWPQYPEPRPFDPGYHNQIHFQPIGAHGEGQLARKRRGNLPKEATAILKSWYNDHIESPYPTEEDKVTLCSRAGLTMNQVSNWFINARRRQPGRDNKTQNTSPGGSRQLPSA